MHAFLLLAVDSNPRLRAQKFESIIFIIAGNISRFCRHRSAEAVTGVFHAFKISAKRSYDVADGGFIRCIKFSGNSLGWHG